MKCSTRVRFVFDQLRFLLRRVPERKRWWLKCYVAVDAALLLRRCLRLFRALEQRPKPLDCAGKRCSIILLSHNRPQNMNVIVDSALRNDFVRRVLVSNSNRSLRIREWIDAKDPRLVVVDETEPTQPGHRFVLADRESGEYFLSVDDDIFLTPRQWATLFEHLVRNAVVPHGIKGNLYQANKRSSELGLLDAFGAEQDVDILVGVYAFTREHLARMFALADTLGIGRVSDLRNGEDILMSFAGAARPKIHCVGRITECMSNALPGIALWKTVNDFFAERLQLFQRTRDARRAMSEPWE